MNKPVLIKSLLFILLLVLIFFSHVFWDIASFFQPEKIKLWLNRMGIFAPLIYMVTMTLAIVISPIPSLPLDIAAGAVFGPFLGTVYSVFGALAGAVVSFMIARVLGREILERFLGGHINFCSECSNKLLTKIVFLSRLLPVVSFDVISYGAGLTKMSLKHFALATFIGMIPLTFMYTYFGSVLVLSKGITLILGLIMVILFFLIPRWIEKKGLFSIKEHIEHHRDLP